MSVGGTRSGTGLGAQGAVVSSLLAGVGGFGFLAAFDLGELWLTLLVGAVAGGLAGWLGMVSVAHRPAHFPSVTVAVPALLLAVLIAAGSTVALGSGGGPGQLLRLQEGWSLALRGHTPLPAIPETLALPYLATAVAAAAGAWSEGLAARRVWAWVPSLVVMVSGLLLGGELNGAPAVVPLLWTGLVLLSVTWRGGRPLALVPGVAALGLVAVVGGAALLLGDRVPLSEERVVLPRSAGSRPELGDQPLNQVTVLQSGRDETLFTVDTEVPVPRWRLAVLDDYARGGRWSSDIELRPAARRLPDSHGCGDVDGVEATHEVTLHLAEGDEDPVWGRWLPVPEDARVTTVEGVGFDRETASLWVMDGDTVPARYEVVALDGASEGSDGDAVTAETVAGTWRPPPKPVSDEAGDLLDDLAERAGEVTAGVMSDYERALWIQQFLLDGELIGPGDATVSGTSLRHVHDLVERDNGLSGTLEQYVTAFVVLARSVDLPVRAVVGFSGADTAGRHEISAHDAAAWVEVCLEGEGWVAFDAVPSRTGEVIPPEELPSRPEPDGDADDEDDDLGDDDGDDGERSDEDDQDADAGPNLVPPAWTWPALLGAVLLGALAASARLPVGRWWGRRRRRLRGDTADGRVAAAWEEVAAELVAGGLPVADRAVAHVVAAGGARLPDIAEPLDELGRLANRSTFARRQPTDADADRAVELARQVLTSGTEAESLGGAERRRWGRPGRRRLRHRVRTGS